MIRIGLRIPPIGSARTRTLILSVVIGVARACEAGQRQFATFQQAVEAMVIATRTAHLAALARIFRPARIALNLSGDPVADRTARERFLMAYRDSHRTS